MTHKHRPRHRGHAATQHQDGLTRRERTTVNLMENNAHRNTYDQLMATRPNLTGNHTDPLQPCRICNQPAKSRDANGQPCHKVCAERQLWP